MIYKSETIKGILYKTLLRVTIRVLGIIKITVAARLLGPVALGLYGIASLVLMLTETVTESGVYIVLIQNRSKFKKYLNSALVISIFRGIIITLIILISIPLVVRFYNNFEIRNILIIISVAPFLRGLVNPALIRYEKDLRFDREFVIRFFLYLIEVVASISFIISYKNITGLVYGTLISITFEIFYSWLFVSPKPRFKLNMKEVKYLINRGKWVTLTGIYNYLFHNIDDIFVGKLLGVHSLGIYQASYKLSTLPVYEVGEIFGRVTLPIYSKISNNLSLLRKFFLLITLSITMISLFFGIILIIFAKDIVNIFLGEEWKESIKIIQLLAIFGILRSITGSVTPLLYSINKQNYAMNIILLGLMILLLIIYPLIMFWGISGAAISTIVATLFTIPIIIKYLKNIFK